MGQPIAITRLDHAASDLREVAARCQDGAVVRRLLALALVLDGRSRHEAAAQTGMDRQTLRDWVHRYNDAGIAGLTSRCAPGRAAALSAREMAELKALVLQGPDLSKDNVVRWRCVDLREQVIQRFSVAVHERTIGKWLRRLKLKQLQPRPCHPKTDFAAQEAFKKTSPAWPTMSCHRSVPARRSRSGSRMKPA